MNLPSEKATTPAQTPVNSAGSLRRFAFLAIGLFVVFIKPLVDLVRLATSDTLYSHIPLIPCVAAYFFWRQKNDYGTKTQPCRWAALLCFVVGLAALLTWFLNRNVMVQTDYLAFTIFAFVSFLAGIYLFSLGNHLFNTAGFPLAFLVFLVPFPIFVANGIEMFFQHASAAAADVMLQLSNAPVYRRGLEFRLPNIVLAVAPECSGIRSTLVLFITSIVAGQLFFKSRWKKVVLVLFVIPLAVVRNGFRIFTIAMLCIHYGPEMIHSFVHKRGGPIFFLLSLIPFFLLLFLLLKTRPEKKRQLQ